MNLRNYFSVILVSILLLALPISKTHAKTNTCKIIFSENRYLGFIGDQIEFVLNRAEPETSAEIVTQMQSLQSGEFVPQEQSNKPIEERLQTKIMAGQPLGELADEFNLPIETLGLFNRSTGNFEPDRARPKQPLALENGDSKLKAIRINYEFSYGSDGNAFPALLSNYLKVLQVIPDLELWVALREFDKVDFENMIKDVPLEIKNRIKTVTTSSLQVELWAQDGSKPFEDGESTLLQTNGNKVKRRDYRKVVWDMEESGLITTETSYFRFEGGNVIVGDDHIFLGVDVVNDLVENIGMDRPEALSALSSDFGKEVIEIGIPKIGSNPEQPEFHIDLTMSLVRDRTSGKEIVLLQSPYALFEQVLGFRNMSEANEVSFRKNIVDFLLKIKQQIQSGQKKSLSIGETRFIEELSKINLAELRLKEAQSSFIADLIEKSNYEVKKIPGWNNLSWTLSTFNYTNLVWSENYVLAPEYEIDFLDQYVYSIFEELGYQVIPMNSVQKLICKRGGIRCASETYRQPPLRESAN